MACLTIGETICALRNKIEKGNTHPYTAELTSAYEYLYDYYKNAQKDNDSLTWEDLQKFIGKPVWYKAITSKFMEKNGDWCIIKELRINKDGRHVCTNDDLIPFGNFEFFRMEK